MTFKQNDNGEILYRVTIVMDTSSDSGKTWTRNDLLTEDFKWHLLNQYRCNGEWRLTCKDLSKPNEHRIDMALDVPEREVERCMNTIRRQGLEVENDGPVDANDNSVENANLLN